MQKLFVCIFMLFAKLSFGFSQPNMSSEHAYNNSDDCNCYTFGSSGFGSGPTGSYNIDPPAYPATILLSQNRSGGFKEGKIKLTPTGLTIKKREII